MDFSLKEAMGIVVALVASAIVFLTLLNFGFFDGIGKIIEKVI